MLRLCGLLDGGAVFHDGTVLVRSSIMYLGIISDAAVKPTSALLIGD